MLLSITISNFALIDRITIPFYKGLHVLTGETGAGKSIVVDAVNLVLGGRADREVIRTGCDKAYVEAVFDVSGLNQVNQLLLEQEIELEDGTLTISREIAQNGRHVCRVMGMVVPLSYLKQLTACLMDVHGQHEHQHLMDVKWHMKLMDDYGDDKHHALIDQTREAYQAFNLSHREYARLYKMKGQREQRLEMLRFARDELKSARLKPGEEEQLLKEKQRIRNAAKITESIGAAYRFIYQGEQGQLSAADAVRQAYTALNDIEALDNQYAALHERLKSLYYELEDAGLQLRDLNNRSDLDASRSEAVEERLDIIRRLSRKYGATVQDMLSRLEAVEAELNQLESIEDTLESLQAEHKRLLKAYRQAAGELSEARHTLATAFESRMMGHLADLGMGKTAFQVAFKLGPEGKKPVPSPQGDDDIEFLIAPNPGEPLKPLSKIASGGELSRLMLAIKSMSAEKGQVDCMVFDEIDTGISGQMAQVVAEKMMAIAQFQQVICVTHLPQIATMADYQYLVEKSVLDGRTHTQVKALDETQRISQIAGMMAGAKGQRDSGMQHAQAMLEAAKKLKDAFSI